MRNYILLTLLAISVCATSLHGQWRQTNPSGGTVTALMKHGSSIISSTFDDGICVSMNDGRSWSSLSDGVGSAVMGLGALDQYLYAATDAGVLRSSDEGVTWQASGVSGSRTFDFATIGSTLFVCTEDRGVLRSIDHGSNWISATRGIPSEFVRSLFAIGSRLFAGTITDGAYRSDDSGKSWVAVNTGLLDTIVLCFETHGTTMFAGTYHAGLFRSGDEGEHWEQVNNGLTNTTIMFVAEQGGSLFAGTLGGLFRSTDNGDTWVALNAGLTTPEVGSLVVSGPNLVAGTWNGRGIYISSDTGATWTLATAGAPVLNSSVSSMAVFDRTLFAGSFNVYGGQNQYDISRTTDGGSSWTDCDRGLPGSQWYIEGFADRESNGERILFAATNNNGVYRSTDSGLSWVEANTGLSNKWLDAIVRTGTALYVGSYKGVFKSIDGADTWSPASTGMADSVVLALALDNGGDVPVLYALAYSMSSYSGTCYYSKNEGASWTRTGTVKGIPGTLVVATNGLFTTSDSGLFYSTNQGLDWMKRNGALTKTRFYTVAEIGNALIAGTDSGVYVSRNYGLDWALANSGLPGDAHVVSFATVGDDLFAGTFPRGIFKRNLSELLGQNTVEADAGFLQIDLDNSPNPFTEKTTIRFTLPTSEFLTLTLYDNTGREVSRLASGEFSPGQHELMFDRRELPAGVYFYRLTCGAKSQARTMLLLR